MPRYHCLDTEVQLCTLDSPCDQSTFVESFVPAMKTLAAEDASIFTEESLQYNRDRSLMVKRLKEEYFKGREGLNFLGRYTPFFLIHAGNDMSDDPHPANQWTGTNDLLNQDQKLHFESSDELTGTKFSKGSPTTAKVVPDIRNQNPTAGERRQHQHDSRETYLFSDGSSLSSLSITEFLSSHASNLRSSEPNVEIAGEPFDSFVTPNNSKWTAKSLGKPCSSPELRVVTKPVQVIVKLSEKSFISPILGNKSNHYDICVNLFYNGEFSASQLVKYSDWVTDKRKGYLYFGGRRVDTCHELPWIITNRPENTDRKNGIIGKSPTLLTPLERWNKLTDMLLLEANEWGRDGRGHRCSTGEYLELLSKTNMPSELYSPTVRTEIGFGVIDVVITLGHVQHNAAKEIGSPRRNLPVRQSQNAGLSFDTGCETRIATQVLATVMDSSQDFSDMQFLNYRNDEDIFRPSSVTEISHTIAAPSYHGDKINSDVLRVAKTTSGSINYNTDCRTVAKVPISTSTRIPAALAIVPTSRAPHPNQPEKIPQKTYRGSESSLPPSQPTRPQKRANIFEELPFDLNTAAYMSTRARRNASMLFAQTTLKHEIEGSLKRKRSVNQDESALLNTESLETTVIGTLLAPKRDRLSDPKTTASDGRSKKKIRSTNYNPKLSNRPQNLRRKNSAGEWIIPPCRKNSSGEWETSPKRSQIKAAGFLGAVADGATTLENEKIFQQVLTGPVQKSNRNTVIRPNTPNRASINKAKITLKENKHPSTSKDNIMEVALKGSATKYNTEIVNSGRSNEVAITRIDDNFTTSPTETAFRRTNFPHTPVKGLKAREILATSPTAAAATVFEDYFRREKKNAMPFGTKNTSRKGTLCMKFFEANINSAGEIVGDGGSKKRWLVRRCTTPECISSPDTGKKPASHSLFEKPKQTISAFTTGPEVDKSTGLLRNLATTKSRRKSGTGNTGDLNASKNSVIATLRGSSVENVQKLQFSAITQPRPRFVIPKHNSRILKLVNTQPITTETASSKQEAQGKSVSLDGSTMISSHEDSPRGTDPDAQCVQRGNASTNVPDGTTGSKRSFRQRTVGSTELKALLESHDRHNVANTSLGAPLEVIDHCQPMTRASRKAISYKPRELIDANEIVADTSVSSDQPVGQIPVTSNEFPRKRRFSGQLFETTTPAANAPKLTKDTDTCISKVVDCAANSKRDFGAPSLQFKKPPLTTHMSETANQSIMATMAFDPSLIRADDLQLNDITQAEIASEVVASPLRLLESTKGMMLYPGGQPAQSADKLKAAVDYFGNALIDNPTSSQLNIKGEALQTKASTVVNFEEAVGEVDMALGHLNRAKTETNNATGDLESLKVHGSTQRVFQNTVAVYSDREKTSNIKTNEKRIADIHGSQEQKAPTSPVRASGVKFWRPDSFCDGSTLAYAKIESWDSIARNPVSYQACRRVETQNEGYFEAFDVLMGVRYVVVGSAEVEEGCAEIPGA